MAGQGNDPINLIIDALVTIEAAMVNPDANSNTPIVYDELTEEPGNYPAIMNVPRHLSARESNGLRDVLWDIDIVMLFGRADVKYSSRLQRLWAGVLLDALSSHQKLGTNPVQIVFQKEIDFDPVTIGQYPYIALTATIRATATGPFTFGI